MCSYNRGSTLARREDPFFSREGMSRPLSVVCAVMLARARLPVLEPESRAG